MAPPKNPNSSTYHLCFLLILSTTTLSAAVSTPYSSLCSSPSPAPDNHTDVDDVLSLIRSFQLSTGYFSGGAGTGGGDSLFSPDDDPFSPRSFSFVPHGVSRTTDPTLVHLTATLALSGPRSSTYEGRRSHRSRRSRRYTSTHSISFVLDGYYNYSSASNDLCMVGTGTDYAVDGSIKQHAGVALRLHVPRPSKLTDPFITGRLKSANFDTIYLVAYDESDEYVYSEKSFCQPPTWASGARGAVQALETNFSCAHLKSLLRRSYKLEYGVRDASASSTFPLRLREPRMHINEMHCTGNGAVRTYVVFSNDTELLGYQHMVEEEAAVADGYWNSTTSQLCLRACRVVRSASRTDLEVRECGIGMSFWFPAVWTIRDRSVTTGLLWNASHNHARASSGEISAWSIGNYWGNLSDVKYNYTMVEDAKKKYQKAGLSKKKRKGRFPGDVVTYSAASYHDFEFHFFVQKQMGPFTGHGDAGPVTIGSAMVDGSRLAADTTFFRYAVAVAEMNKSRHAVAEMDQSQLLNVSYDISYRFRSANWQRPNNRSYSVSVPEDEHRQISAEGVYDPKTGILFMIGCQELNGSTDCQILVTVSFASLDAKAQGHGRGMISSLRDKADRLYFEAMDIVLYGMYTEQVSESISRVDLESIMVVLSTTLLCVFTVLQILHTKRNPEAPPATSITMLVILALGYITPLVLNFEALFITRRKYYVPFSRNGSLDLNEVMLRLPTLVAFVLLLRLLQLVWSGRRSADRTEGETSLATERKALRICLPLYLIGGAVTVVGHVINGRAATDNPLIILFGPDPPLWEDLVPYAGLILDGFLLPQIILNALSGSRVRAISPWFYVGCTMLRAMPHVYDVIRRQNYVPSMSPSYMYASPRDDLFSVAWDVVIPCGAALLALLLFLQQLLGGGFLLCPRRRRSGEYEMVSSL